MRDKTEERTYTVGILNNAGPAAIQQQLILSDTHGHRYLEAWISNFGGSNVHLFGGKIELPEAQNRMETGWIDCLMTLSGTGPTTCRLPRDVRWITAFFEAQNASGQSQAVTLKVTTVPADE